MIGYANAGFQTPLELRLAQWRVSGFVRLRMTPAASTTLCIAEFATGKSDSVSLRFAVPANVRAFKYSFNACRVIGIQSGSSRSIDADSHVADFEGVVFGLDSDGAFAQEIGLGIGDRSSVQCDGELALFRRDLDCVPLSD